MGHYSDAYEEDAKQRKQKYQATLKDARVISRQLRLNLPDSVPNRFKESLEDLDNWLDKQCK